MEAPISSDSDDGSDESVVLLPEGLEDEVDINIHFHCEHCFKIGKCREMSKPGWSCSIIDCSYGCGLRFHECKSEEHALICSHIKVPCLNQKNGCPFSMPRKNIALHLPVCPASIVICNAEWNRWALGAREREKVAPCLGYTSLYENYDLDVQFALEDQRLVNELHPEPGGLRRILCNEITRRFPGLPLNVRGTYRDDSKIDNERRSKSHSTTDDEEETLTPGLSKSVCTSLLRGNKAPRSDSLRNGHTLDRKSVGDISAYCCSHGIMKDMCHFCKDDPDEPNFKIAHVWREKLSFNTPGKIYWKREPRVEKVRKRGPLGTFVYKKVDDMDDSENDAIYRKPGNMADEKVSAILKRFRTPSPVPLNAKALNIELVLKDYSRHQTKPQAMFTFQCMQEVRRDQYYAHYQNVHSEIQEGLDGWLMERCPLHIFGCPFSVVRMHPHEKCSLSFSAQLNSFGVTCIEEETSKKTSQPSSRASSIDRSLPLLEGTKRSSIGVLKSIPEMSKNHGTSAQYGGDESEKLTELNLLMLPIEILERIASNLDAFTLNSLSMTCQVLREVCSNLLYEKGLVIQEWIQYTDDNGAVRWRNGYNRWFFPKTFSFVDRWRFSNLGCVANHLSQCPFNIRQVSEKKFNYTEGYSEKVSKQVDKLTRACS